MEKISGGQLTAEALIQQGVEIIFTLSGGHITPIYQYLEHSPIKLFDTRHEQSCGFYGRGLGPNDPKTGYGHGHGRTGFYQFPDRLWPTPGWPIHHWSLFPDVWASNVSKNWICRTCVRHR